MPEFAVKEVRLPELHLPEIERDQIVRALSGVHVPQVDLARPDRARLVAGLRPVIARWRKRGLPPVDLGKLVGAAVTASRFVPLTPSRSRWSRIRRSPGTLLEIVRPKPHRSRGRLVLVIVAIAALAGWALLRSPGGRARIDRARQQARRWIDERRADRPADIEPDDIESGAGEPVAMTTAEPAAVATDEPASTVA